MEVPMKQHAGGLLRVRAVAVFLPLLLAACGGGSTQAALVLTGLGSIEGIIVSDPGGHRFGAAPGAAGVEVTVIGGPGPLMTDAQGAFRFDGLPAGSHVLRIGPAAGPFTDIAVTVVGDAVIDLTPPAVDRAAAAAAVLAALSVDHLPDTIALLSPLHPLPEGVAVGPGMGDKNGNEDPALGFYVPAGRHWFFFADPYSDTFFQHPTYFVTVDAATGDVVVRSSTAWPVLNGVGFYADHSASLASPDLVQAPTNLVDEPPTDAVLTGTARLAAHVPGCTDGKTYALLIRGGTETSMSTSFDDFEEMLIDVQGAEAGNIEKVEAPTNNPVGQIRTKLAAIKAKLTVCDTLWVYIIAHGYSGDSAVADFTVVDPGLALWRDEVKVPFGPNDIDLRDVVACHIYVVVDSCYSGNWINAPNGNLMSQLVPKTGLEAMIITSADRTHTANLRFVLHLPGAVFTDYFVEGMEDASELNGDLPADPLAGFDKAKSDMDFNTGPTITGTYAKRGLASMPQAWVRPRQPGETCAGPVTGVVLGTTLSPTLTAGAFVALSRVSGGNVVGGHGLNCEEDHLHSVSPGGIMIDGQGPFPDPDPSACGYGLIEVR
jgi:hypothetical protein